MKFSPVVLLLLLVFDGLQGLTLPQERPDKGHNTSLLANFSGLYERRNPCNNEKVESSSYEASHEFHHYSRGANWTDYTHKCSTLISNFLKSICNLIKFNNKHDGTFTFHVNTSISQKQADQHNCTDPKYSLPTIIIEATHCVTSEQNKKPEEKGLTEEGPTQKINSGLFKKQKSPENLEKSFGELSAVSQETSTYSTLREEAEVDRPVIQIPDGPVETFQTTQITEQATNTNNIEQTQKGRNALVQIPKKYVAEPSNITPINSREAINKASQIDATERLALGGTEKPNLGSDNQYRNSELEIKPSVTFEEITSQEKSLVSQPKLSSNNVRKEVSDFILPASLITQQPNNALYSRASQLPQNDNPHLILTTVSPISRVEKQETVEERTEFSEQSESLNAGNVQQISPFDTNINPNLKPVQPAETLDYLKKETEFNAPKIVHRTTGLPEYLDRFGHEKVPAESSPKKQPQMLKQSDILQYAPLTSEASSGTSSVNLEPQTHLDATAQPKLKISLGQGFDYPVSEKSSQESSYSQRETHLTSSELTELNRDSQYYTTLPPKSVAPRYIGKLTGTPSAFPVDELSGQKPSTRALEFPGQKHLSSKIDKKAGNVHGTQPGQNPSYTPQGLSSYQKTTPSQPAESLIESNQKTPLGTTVQGPLPLTPAKYGEKVVDQFQSSKQSDSTYSQISKTNLESNQNFPGLSVYDKIKNMENIPSREQLQPKTVLDGGNTQPLDYLPTTSLPKQTNNGERTSKNLTFKSERQHAGQLANFSEQTNSSKPSENRPPVTEPTTDANPVTYSPRRNIVSSLGKKVVTTESSLRQASHVKPNFYPPQVSNYNSPAPTQDNRFVSESSLTSDAAKYDLSDSFSTTSSSFLPPTTVSRSKNQKTSLEPRTDYYDVAVKQPESSPPNELSEDSPTISYSGPKPHMITTVYESNSSNQSQQLDALSTGIYESQTTSAPRPVDMIIPLEIQSNEENMPTFAPKTVFPDYGTNYGKNFDSLTSKHSTTSPFESQSETELGNVSPKPTKSSANPLPVGPPPLIFSPEDLFREGEVKTSPKIESLTKTEPSSLKPLNYQIPSSLPKFQQPLRTSKNIPDRNQFSVVTRPQSRTTEQFSETTSNSSDVYLQKTSSTLVPPSASQEFAANNAQEDSLLTMDSQSENAFASKESYYLNQNSAETFSEQREYGDTVSSQDAKTQIPQPQPSFDYSDYSGQLSSNERKSNTPSTNLQTSKTFEGSKPNIQPLQTYSPLPSIPSKTETFTTETYESDELSSQLEPEPVVSTALEKTETNSSSFGQSPLDQNIETIDITELPEVYSTLTYDGQFIPVTPPPSLTVIEEPPFVKTSLLAHETYAVPETFVQNISTTSRPQSTNSVIYDQEIITIDSQPTPSPSPVPLLPVNYSGQFLNEMNEQDFVGRSLAVTQQTEDRLERSDNKETTSQTVVKNSNRDLKNDRITLESNSNEDTEASSTALIQTKYDASPLLNKGTNNFPKTETKPNSFGLITSTVRPVHTKTTIDEEVITTDNSNFLTLSSTQAPPVGYSQKLSSEQFDGQRRYLPSANTPQPSRQFHPENRPFYHPSQEFPPHHQFDHRSYGNYPQPLNFNPQAPRPWPNHFNNFAREQHNQFPTSFPHNQFQSHFPVSGPFQPGLNTQRDVFMFPSQPSNYGNRYFPHERPESLPPSSQVPPNFHSFQHPNVFQQRDSQYQSYQAEGRLGEKDLNGQSSASQYAQNYEPYSYYPRNDFSERFGPSRESFGSESRDRFHPDQIPYNRIHQMMPPYRNHPGGYLNLHGPSFLNNSSQQVEDRDQHHNFDNRAYSVKDAKMQEAQKTNPNQASPEVLADYKKALTGLASGEKLVEFDEEVITISPEKGPSTETTVVTDEHEQRQNAASYNSQNQGRQHAGSLLKFNSTTASGQMLETSVPPQQAQQGNPVFRAQNSHVDFPLPSSSASQSHASPFSYPVDSFGPQRLLPPPNFSNQFRSASSDFQQQSNANFVNARKPNVGNEAGSNPSQSHSYALGPDQIFPSRQPGENYIPFYGRRCNKSLPCPCDRIVKGNMTAPSYYVLISKLPVGAGGEGTFKVEKVYLGDGTHLNYTFYEGQTFPTSRNAPLPFSAAGQVKLPTKNP